MAYTSAALSFALQNLPVPVIVVGAQRSSDRPAATQQQTSSARLKPLEKHRSQK